MASMSAKRSPAASRFAELDPYRACDAQQGHHERRRCGAASRPARTGARSRPARTRTPRARARISPLATWREADGGLVGELDDAARASAPSAARSTSIPPRGSRSSSPEVTTPSALAAVAAVRRARDQPRRVARARHRRHPARPHGTARARPRPRRRRDRRARRSRRRRALGVRRRQGRPRARSLREIESPGLKGLYCDPPHRSSTARPRSPSRCRRRSSSTPVTATASRCAARATTTIRLRRCSRAPRCASTSSRCSRSRGSPMTSPTRPSYEGRRVRELDRWEEQLHAAYRGSADHPVFVALADTADRFALPITEFTELMSGFRTDLERRRYATFDELRGYTRQAAEPRRPALAVHRRLSRARAPRVRRGSRVGDRGRTARRRTSRRIGSAAASIVPAQDLRHFGVDRGRHRVAPRLAGGREPRALRGRTHARVVRAVAAAGRCGRRRPRRRARADVARRHANPRQDRGRRTAVVRTAPSARPARQGARRRARARVARRDIAPRTLHLVQRAMQKR